MGPWAPTPVWREKGGEEGMRHGERLPCCTTEYQLWSLMKLQVSSLPAAAPNPRTVSTLPSPHAALQPPFSLSRSNSRIFQTQSFFPMQTRSLESEYQRCRCVCVVCMCLYTLQCVYANGMCVYGVCVCVWDMCVVCNGCIYGVYV